MINTMYLVYKKKGILFLIISTIKILFGYPYYKFLRSSKTFKFQETNYHYFIHYYNLTWENERTIEIPIMWNFINKFKGKKILEIGNVLTNYFRTNHEILDKYETIKGVINEDICDFKPKKQYDLIISISTLEHVGFDETPREPRKILKAFENLNKLLARGGTMVITLPLGYNPFLDDLLRKKELRFTKMYCLKRISQNNEWREVNWDDIAYAKYNEPFPNANGLIIGIVSA